MSDLNKIINEQRERIAELEQENALLLVKTLPECNCEGLQQRIAELETELDKAYNDLANFEGYPEEVSALRHDIERRKQRYKKVLLNRSEWKKRAEAAETKLENERMISMKRFIETGRADTFAIQQKAECLNSVAKELNSQFLRDYNNKHINSEAWSQWCRVFGAINSKAEQLRQQLNGGE